jgi:hypothetical protein
MGENNDLWRRELIIYLQAYVLRDISPYWDTRHDSVFRKFYAWNIQSEYTAQHEGEEYIANSILKQKEWLKTGKVW